MVTQTNGQNHPPSRRGGGKGRQDNKAETVRLEHDGSGFEPK